ncbi:MAG: phosphatidylinositol kinase- protein kinase tor1, partial [Tremellales sp. Tagirdzhanova-0007]
MYEQADAVDVLDSIFFSLGSKHDHIRVAASKELYSIIVLYAQDHTEAEDIKGLWTDIFHRTFPITRSNNGYERLGAIAAIDKMLDATNEIARQWRL